MAWPEVPCVFQIFPPTGSDSGDSLEISYIQERLQTFLSAVAQAQRGWRSIATAGTVTINVPAEPHPHGSGLQIIEFVQNFVQRPNLSFFIDRGHEYIMLEPNVSRARIGAKYKSVCRDLYRLPWPKVIMPRELVHWRLGHLVTDKVYFVSPQCYADLVIDQDTLDFESAKKWSQDEQVLKYKFVAFPVLVVVMGNRSGYLSLFESLRGWDGPKMSKI
jgi:hypothetical protein